MFIPGRTEDGIIKATVKKTGLSTIIVDKIHSFQWKIVLEATSIYKDIEITGLGRLKTKIKVVNSNIEIQKNKIEKCFQQLELTDDLKSISRINTRIKDYEQKIEFLKSKL